MSAEDRYRSLLAELERCPDYGRRDVILDDLIELTPSCFFSNDEYLRLQARLDMIAIGMLGGGFGLVN